MLPSGVKKDGKKSWTTVKVTSCDMMSFVINLLPPPLCESFSIASSEMRKLHGPGDN